MTALTGLILNDSSLFSKGAQAMGAGLLDRLPGRGADDTHAWAHGPVLLAARAGRTRDLTPDGTQPYVTRDRRMAIVWDGYVANAAGLRRELEETGFAFTGHGDAELVAEAANRWSLNRLLQKLEGAFAFALWDEADQALHLVRDRLNARPLYVTKTRGGFAFASDMNAFTALPDFKAAIDTQGAGDYLAFGHVQAPQTLWRDVMALPAGHRLMIRPGDKELQKPESYWSPANTLEESALRARGLETSRLDRLSNTVVGEAIRIDTPFAMLEDASPASAQLRSLLDRVCEKPFKTIHLRSPDGAAVQTAFDTLAKLCMPVSDPAAPAWLEAFKTCEAAVCLLASQLRRPVDEDAQTRKMRKILNYVPFFLARLVPVKYAHLTEKSTWEKRARLWPHIGKTPEVHMPRIDLAPDQRRAFFEFALGFCGNVLPSLDRIAGFCNVEMRMALADARMLDFGLPGLADSGDNDIILWLRGPLRPRMQDLMTPSLFAAIGIDDISPYTASWAAFLAGNDREARKLWVLATLLAWTKAHVSAKLAA